MLTREATEEYLTFCEAGIAYFTAERQYLQECLVNEPPTFAVSHELRPPETTSIADWYRYLSTLESQKARAMNLINNIANFITQKHIDLTSKINDRIRSIELQNNAIARLQQENENQNQTIASIRHTVGRLKNLSLGFLFVDSIRPVPPANPIYIQTDLPVIREIGDLDQLTREQVEILLDAYNIRDRGTVRQKKRKIARAIGMASAADERYSFNGQYI